jgi:Ca-activated chloride channel homolog
VNTPFGMLMQQASDLDPATLKAIAKTTGGRYFQATDTTRLEQIYDELDRLEPSIRDSRSFREMTALFMWPAGIALFITIGLGMAALGWLVPARQPAEVADESR